MGKCGKCIGYEGMRILWLAPLAQNEPTQQRTIVFNCTLEDMEKDNMGYEDAIKRQQSSEPKSM